MTSSIEPRGECPTGKAECDCPVEETKPKEETKTEEKKTKRVNPWLEHVKAFCKAHPDLKYKDVLVQAKSTYTKVVKS